MGQSLGSRIVYGIFRRTLMLMLFVMIMPHEFHHKQMK